MYRAVGPLTAYLFCEDYILWLYSTVKAYSEIKCNHTPAAQSTAMPRIPLRPIPDVTMLRNPDPSGFMRRIPFWEATVLLKSHQYRNPDGMCTSTCRTFRPVGHTCMLLSSLNIQTGSIHSLATLVVHYIEYIIVYIEKISCLYTQ